MNPLNFVRWSNNNFDSIFEKEKNIKWAFLVKKVEQQINTQLQLLSQVDVMQSILSSNATLGVAMALDGHGICRLPEFYLDNYLQQKKLIAILQEYQLPQVDLYALYPTRKHLSPKVRSFIDLLTEELSV